MQTEFSGRLAEMGDEMKARSAAASSVASAVSTAASVFEEAKVAKNKIFESSEECLRPLG